MPTLNPAILEKLSERAAEEWREEWSDDFHALEAEDLGITELITGAYKLGFVRGLKLGASDAVI